MALLGTIIKKSFSEGCPKLIYVWEQLSVCPFFFLLGKPTYVMVYVPEASECRDSSPPMLEGISVHVMCLPSYIMPYLQRQQYIQRGKLCNSM